VAFVTGAASGIGRATVFQLIADGIGKVALIDYNAKGLKEAEEEVHTRYPKVETVSAVADISKKDDVDQAMQKVVNKFDRIHFCVNAAGTGGNLAAKAFDVDNRNKVMDINVYGTWNCVDAQIEHFLKHERRPTVEVTDKEGNKMELTTRGSIVNVVSILGTIAMPNQVAYTTSKHAMIGFTKACALQYAKDGIYINAMCPGFVDTPLVSAAMWKGLEPVIKLTPMQRKSYVEEIARSTSFLACDRSSYTTGAIFNVDGGYTAGVTPM